MRTKWNQVQKHYILNNKDKSDNELLVELNRLGPPHSLDALRKFRQRLGLSKSKGRPSKVKKGEAIILGREVEAVLE